MKLIIDISEDKFDLIQMLVISGMGDYFHKIVAQGTPLEQIRDEIEAIQQDVLKSSETPLDSAYNISIGISMALGVIDKYTK